VKRLAALFLLVVSAALAAAPAQPERSDLRLILLIAVDQFRYDYLTRFRSEYTSGLRRLLNDGAVFVDANLEHYPTVTAVGHSTMLSGATPSVSGIIGNDWFDRETASTVTSVSDTKVAVLGGLSDAAASPHRLLVTTVGDQLKLASAAARGSDAAPRVIGVSLKDRAAILPVGRGADAAYWWDTKAGAFVTSTYYGPSLRPWVAAFNARRPADAWVGKPWAVLSDPTTVFQQLPKQPGPDLYQAVYNTPYGSDLLLEFATKTLEEEKLGQRGVLDLMSVSFSSNDAIGHKYGPDSPQVRDVSIRTDRVIGALLDRIDRAVGLQHTLVALTADHGVAPLPEVLQKQSLPGGRMASKDLFDPMQQALEKKYGPGKWLLSTAGSSPYFNYELAAKVGADLADVRRVAAQAAMAVPHVTRVYTRDELARGVAPDDRIGHRIIRGFNQQRSGDLEIILEPYWIRDAAGATHGTPYNYDAHIPLILMGARIKPGEYADPVALNDLAPTLATLANVEIPAGSVGRVLTEAIRPAARPEATPPGRR
jgi:hypothetical protein